MTAGSRIRRRCRILLLAGCTVGPNYTAGPPVPAAPAFSEQPPQSFTESKGWKQAQPADDNVARGLVAAFRQRRSSNGLEEQINPSNQTLKAAEARFREARALIQLNRSESLSLRSRPRPPSLPTASRSNAPTGTRARRLLANYTLPIDVNYELDAWGRVHRSIAAAREETQASAGDLETIRLSLHAELAIDYFELRSLDAQKQLARRDAGGLPEGARSDAEPLRWRTELAGRSGAGANATGDHARPGYRRGRGSRASFEHAIAVLTGRTPESLSLPVAPLNIHAAGDSRGHSFATAGAPPRYRRGRTARRPRPTNRLASRARPFSPTCCITATGGFEGSTPVNWLTWPSRFWAVGPTMAGNHLRCRPRGAQFPNSATASYDETVANYRQAALTAFQQVEDNLATLARSGGAGESAARGRGGGAAIAGPLSQPLQGRPGDVSGSDHRAKHRAAE